MSLLLDTHVVLWCLSDPDRIPEQVKRSMGTQQVNVSIVSIWEIAVKRRINKINVNAQAIFDAITDPFSKIEILQLSEQDIFAYESLPIVDKKHRDPFDHLLISQALTRRLTLISADGRFRQYSGLDLIPI